MLSCGFGRFGMREETVFGAGFRWRCVTGRECGAGGSFLTGCGSFLTGCRWFAW